VVESVYGDPAHDRLLLSEEDLNQSCLKVYDLKGSYGGRDAGRGVFTSQVEGIALWDRGAAPAGGSSPTRTSNTTASACSTGSAWTTGAPSVGR
jgi:hypothetical protein